MTEKLEQVLICTDLDRTLLPNGTQPESPAARPLFKRLVAEPFITLAYVSGRDLKLVEQAISSYDLPVPDFLIGDVGTTIYCNHDGSWQLWQEWQDIIGRDWQGMTAGEIGGLLGDVSGLELQEAEKQSRFKLSYYYHLVEPAELAKRVGERLGDFRNRVRFVSSVDEVKQIGLFDILPRSASKLHAVNFLLEKSGILPARAVYAGDSGNDLEVLTSALKAILVANATDDVRSRVVREAPQDTLYLARGDFMAMNGNYAAGILEGIVHFLPELGGYFR